MFQQLHRIQKFGVYNDLRGPGTVPPFKRYNIFYGWNYSGKTTLSRIFQAFETRQPDADFPEAKAVFADVVGQTHCVSDPSTAPECRVFNSDFVARHLKFDDSAATPFLILGEEEIEKQETVTQLRRRLLELEATYKDQWQLSEQIKTDLNTRLRDKASDAIKMALRVPNYDKTRFEPIVEACAKNPTEHMLSDLDFEKERQIYDSSEKRPHLTPVMKGDIPLPGMQVRAHGLLKRTVSEAARPATLSKIAEIESWVRDGMHLHKNSQSCHFCGESIPTGRLSDLESYFAQEYHRLLEELRELIDSLYAAEKQEPNLPHRSEIYPELADEYDAAKAELVLELESRRTAIRKLSEQLIAKQSKLFTAVELTPINDSDVPLSMALGKINTVIEAHNRRSREFEGSRITALTRIIAHLAADFAVEVKYLEKKEAAGRCMNLAQQAEEESIQTRAEVARLELEIMNAQAAVDKVNEHLRRYFGRDRIGLKVDGDGSFRIFRDGRLAKRLSEGEQTAIAFAYFLARIQSGDADIEELCVFIDDPISSLDGNHIFNTCSLIRHLLADCRQLFISTHNFEFFGLLRDWAHDQEKKTQKEYDTASWTNWSPYLIQRNHNGESTIEALPKELWLFRSEYHYLFSRIYHFAESTSIKPDDLFGLPNIVRRFLEAFGGIMMPGRESLRTKIEKIIPDKLDAAKVYHFINHFSHNQTLVRSLKIPDYSESKDIARLCLDAIKAWDADYYLELIKGVT